MCNPASTSEYLGSVTHSSSWLTHLISTDAERQPPGQQAGNQHSVLCSHLQPQLGPCHSEYLRSTLWHALVLFLCLSLFTPFSNNWITNLQRQIPLRGCSGWWLKHLGLCHSSGILDWVSGSCFRLNPVLASAGLRTEITNARSQCVCLFLSSFFQMKWG